MRATAPANPDAASSDLQFNDPAPPQTPPVPRAELLPDRFVVLAYDQPADGVAEVARASAPPSRTISSSARSALAESWLDARPGDRPASIVPDALKWMIDFDAAVSVGMAVRIPLSAPVRHDGLRSRDRDRRARGDARRAGPGGARSAARQAPVTATAARSCAPARRPTTPTAPQAAGNRRRPMRSNCSTIEDAPPDIAPRDRPARHRRRLAARDAARAERRTSRAGCRMRRRPTSRGARDEPRRWRRARSTNSSASSSKAWCARRPARTCIASSSRWVTGRGHYPALRVGRQPYGIVVTSAWKTLGSAPAERAIPAAAATSAPACTR